MDKLSIVPFNKINIYHIYDYYDEPILYSFVTETGSLLLADFMDYDEENDIETWTYLPISYNELNELEHQKLSLYDLYQKCVSEKIYVEKQSNTSDQFSVEYVANLDPSWLPDRDSYVPYEDKSNIDNATIYDNTIVDNRYGINFSVKPNNGQYEMPAIVLSEYLPELQKMLIALKQPKTSKKLSKKYENDRTVQLNVVGTYASSFGIRLFSDGNSSLINDEESLPYQKIIELFQEVQHNKDIDADAVVEKYGWLVLEHLTKLSKCFESVKGGKIEAQIPKPGSGTQKLQSGFTTKKINKFVSKIEEISPNIDKKELPLEGTITRYDSKAKTFSFTSENDEGKEKIYKGAVKTLNKSFTVPSVGKAILLEIKSSDSLNRVEDNFTYELMSWEEKNN